MDIYFQLKLFYLVLAFLTIHLLAILHSMVGINNYTNSQTRINVYFPFHLEERTRNAHRIKHLKY